MAFVSLGINGSRGGRRGKVAGKSGKNIVHVSVCVICIECNAEQIIWNQPCRSMGIGRKERSSCLVPNKRPPCHSSQRLLVQRPKGANKETKRNQKKTRTKRSIRKITVCSTSPMNIAHPFRRPRGRSSSRISPPLPSTQCSQAAS